MPTINGKLTPYCPALPLLGSQLHKASRGDLAPKALALLRDNQAIVVSGRFHYDWQLNRQIYKTRDVKNRLMSRLRRAGKKASYLNIDKVVRRRDHLGFNVYDYAPLTRKARAMPDADVYVLDEVQHAIPFAEEMRFRRMRREPYEDAMMALWDKVAKGLERGGRLVLVTCFHPYDQTFEGSLLNGTMALFFSSPVLELGWI